MRQLPSVYESQYDIKHKSTSDTVSKPKQSIASSDTKEKLGNVRTKAVDGTKLTNFVHSWAVPASLVST